VQKRLNEGAHRVPNLCRLGWHPGAMFHVKRRR
jgi:hypothetical protein